MVVNWIDNSEQSKSEDIESVKKVYFGSGVKISSRAVVRQANIVDIEETNRIVAEWNKVDKNGINLIDYYVAEISDKIKESSNRQNGSETTSFIESAWDKLDRLCSLAENRLRLSLPRGEKISPCEELSDSIQESLENLRQDPASSLAVEQVIQTCKNLLECLPQSLVSRLSIEIAWIGLCSVEIKLGHIFTWIVYPSRLPWPGVRLKSLRYDVHSMKLAETRNFFLASSALRFALSHLSEHER